MKRLFLIPLFLAAAARAQDTNYVTRSDLAAYAERADLAPLVTHATLSNYSLVSDLSAYATASDLAGLATTASLSNYVTRSDLAAYATGADLAGIATTASLSNYVTRSDLGAGIAAYLASNPPAISDAALTNYALRSELAAYATAADLSGLATTASLSNYVSASSLGAGIATYLASNPPAISDAALTNYALHSDLAAYAPLSALADLPTFADLSGYATTSALGGYATTADLGAYAPLSALSGYATLSMLSGYATLSSISDFLTVSDLSNYVLRSDLAAYATASELSALAEDVNEVKGWENAFSDAEYDENADSWVVSGDIDFEDDVFFGDNLHADHLAVGGDLTLGGETRTNWNDVQSLTILDDEEACPTANDGFVWTFPEDNNCRVYLTAGPSATNRTRTIVIRHIESGGGGTATEVYDGPAAPSTTTILHSLTATNPTAIFDWSPHDQTWHLR